MFGRGWERAHATVIASQQLDGKAVYSSGRGTLRRRREYVLDVQPPAGGPVFRTTVVSPLNVNSMRDLSIGEVVPVLCHAKGQKVKFDTSDPAISHEAVKSARRARFEEIANAAPGSAPGSAGGESAGGASDPKADLIRLSIAKAERKGDAAEVDRLSAMLADIEHGTSGPPSE